MNDKKAKKLRRQARAMTRGAVATSYRVVERGNHKPPAFVTVVDSRCTRGVYRALKAQAA